MKVVKKTTEYTIYQKRNDRYGVKSSDKKWINGDDKVKILLAEDLIKVTEPKAEEPEEVAEEETTEEVTDSAEEAASEE